MSDCGFNCPGVARGVSRSLGLSSSFPSSLRTADARSPDETVFSRGSPCNAVFYIQSGKVKLTVLSGLGKEAIVAMLGPDEFVSEACITGQPVCLASAETVTDAVIVRMAKAVVIKVIHDEPAFAELFIAYLLKRTMRIEAHLVNQLSNSSENRLARASAAWRCQARELEMIWFSAVLLPSRRPVSSQLASGSRLSRHRRN